MMWRILFFLIPDLALADSLVASRTIRALSIITASDVVVVPSIDTKALAALDQVVGLEARVAIYAGRTILASDLRSPAVVDRNQLVQLSYESAALTISTEGRALARGGVGDVIKVINLTSRSTVFGRIAADGTVLVGPNF